MAPAIKCLIVLAIVALLFITEKTCLAGINPKRPQAIAPLIAVIAKGISSVINNRATIANTIKHLIACCSSNKKLNY